MQLIKIDVIGLKTLQRPLDGSENVAGVELRRRAAQPGHLAATRDFRREDDLVAILARFEPTADDPLGRALRFGARRN
jgi:hypothetical protein